MKKYIKDFVKTMGIKDLRTFLKNKNVDCFYQMPLLDFYGKRWAIDSLNWVFCYMGSAVKMILSRKSDPLDFITQDELYDRMIIEFINFNVKLMNHGITPVWIWDGESKDNKQVTKVERRNARKLMIEKKENIINTLKSMNPLERPPELLNELRQLITTTTSLKRERIEDLRKFSEEIGIPTIVADDEAESLAASLAVERIVGAAWTADTDTYAIGCPIVVKGFENISGEVCVNAVFTPKILKALELNHEEFRDFCIMLGTDFNDRIHGLGPARSYKLIQLYRNLETVEEKTSHNLYMLKFREIREQFFAYDTKYNGVDDLMVNTSVDYEAIQEKYKGRHNLDKVFTCLRNLVKPTNVTKID